MNAMDNNKIKTVAIYARVSTNKQEAQNQLAELYTFADRQGWEIISEYTDQQSGGTSERKEFKRLFSDAHKRKFDLVLFWALDRFSREGALATLKHLEQLQSYGVAYKSYTEQYIDSAGIFKDAIVAIMSTLAKQERVRLSERTKAGLARAKAQGKRLGMTPLSPTTIAKIKRLRKQEKLSYRVIASTVGVSLGSVANVLKG